MKVKWLGHACFLVTGEDGRRILTDPYEAGYKGLINYDKIAEAADIVTVSHEHGDHNAVAEVPGQPRVVRGAGRREVGGVPFEGVASHHDRAGGRERGTNTIMAFAVDGVRVCHLGDLGHALSREQVAAIGKVDVLLVPVGGPAATCELEDAWAACEQINPRIVIPMHFRNDKCSFPKHDVADFTRGRSNVEAVNGSELELRADTLPSETRVVVLQHAL